MCIRDSYEGGGLSANIRGDQVLVGSAAFMNLMDISLPQGLNVKNAVFCAIDGQLAGIFALNYTLHDTVFPAMEELMGEKVGPVLATRDLISFLLCFSSASSWLRTRWTSPLWSGGGSYLTRSSPTAKSSLLCCAGKDCFPSPSL